MYASLRGERSPYVAAAIVATANVASTDDATYEILSSSELPWARDLAVHLRDIILLRQRSENAGSGG